MPSQVINTWSYPDAAAFRFELPYKNGNGTVFFTWHDGGMKPNIPYGYKEDDLPIEGMMFIGEKGAITGGFLQMTRYRLVFRLPTKKNTPV